MPALLPDADASFGLHTDVETSFGLRTDVETSTIKTAGKNGWNKNTQNSNAKTHQIADIEIITEELKHTDLQLN